MRIGIILICTFIREGSVKRHHSFLIVMLFLLAHPLARSAFGVDGAPPSSPAASAELDAPIRIDPEKLAAAHASLRPSVLNHRWSVFASVGLSGVGSSRYAVNAASSTLNVSDTMSTGLAAGGGVSYLINPIFQLGGDFEYSSYRYSSGAGADSDLLVLFVPRVQTQTRALTLWAGLGTGFAITKLANSPAISSLGAIVPASAMGLAFSPQVGADLDLGKIAFIGAELSYVFMSGSLSGPGSGYDRRWASLALRCGTRF
jgi:hypothetical protein